MMAQKSSSSVPTPLPFASAPSTPVSRGGVLEPSSSSPFLRLANPDVSKHRIMEGGSATPFPRTTPSLSTTSSSTAGGSQQGDREAAIDAEIARVNKLPANSSYAIHRMKVLSKLRHLMSIKRTTSQDEELELLFASLSI